MRHRLGLFYGILVSLLLVMGAWWVYYLAQEGKVHAEFLKQKLANDRMHAVFLIESDPHVRADPERWLGEGFPQLIFRQTPEGVEIEIDPAVLAEIDREAATTRNMFLYEGIFFLILLGAGSTILILSWRSEMRFKQARELFLAGATHEFKTPLASLRLYTETLGREGLAPEDQSGIRDRMVEDILRLEGLVNEVLALSADDTFGQDPRVRLDLAEECRTVVGEVERFTAEAQARFRLQADEDCYVRGSRLTLVLALRNLVVNAVRHSPDPVRVDITVKRGRKWHEVVIRDDGPGIPRRLQEKVFECFYTGGRDDRSTGGAGLGLYLVKRNVQNLGGHIELTSEEGRGCVFSLRLPALATEE